MDKTSELLMRSTLHDMGNILAGVKGILDLNDPDQPISQRDRQRLEAVIDEGVATLDRARHLTMATLPEGALEAGPAWRDQLLEDLGPMATLFRSRYEISFEGAPEWDQWPGHRLRSYVRAVTRQVIPQAKGGVMSLGCVAGPDEWLLRWSPVPFLPESLAQGPEDGPADTCVRWAARVGSALGASLGLEGGALLARIPRQFR
jgi:hypothetical protein